MESHARTLGKTISWRFIAMLITAALAWVFTGDVKAGMAIGLADTLVKFIVYYLHERAWASVATGYRFATMGHKDGEGI